MDKSGQKCPVVSQIVHADPGQASQRKNQFHLITQFLLVVINNAPELGLAPPKNWRPEFNALIEKSWVKWVDSNNFAVKLIK